MKWKTHFIALRHQLRIGMSRFAVAALCCCLLFCTGTLVILVPRTSAWIYPLQLALVLCFLLDVAVRLWEEGSARPRKAVLLLPPCAGALCFGVLWLWGKNSYVTLGFWGLCAALAFLCLALFYRTENDTSLFGSLVCAAVFSGVFALVLMLGLFLCLAAFAALLFEPQDVWHIYEIIGLLAWVLVFPLLLLARLPRAEQAHELPRVYAVLTSYVALPLYLLLLGILYGYCAKIAITRQLPQGEINWFASFALLFYVLFYLGIRADKSALSRFFVRWGGALLLPVVAVQCICVGVRVSAYGLTPARWLSLACICFGVLAIVHSFTRLSLSHLMLAGAVLAVLVTLTPLNALDVPQWSQEARLRAVLQKSGMLRENQIVQTDTVPDEEALVRMTSCYAYLRNSPARRSAFVEAATADSFEAVFGFPSAIGASASGEAVTHLSYQGNQFAGGLDVRGYTRVYPPEGTILSGSTLTVTSEDGRTVHYNLSGYFSSLRKAYPNGTTSETDLTFAADENTRIVFQFLTLELMDNSLQDAYGSCYVLQK